MEHCTMFCSTWSSNRRKPSLEASEEMILRIDYGHGDQNQRALNSDVGA